MEEESTPKPLKMRSVDSERPSSLQVRYDLALSGAVGGLGVMEKTFMMGEKTHTWETAYRQIWQGKTDLVKMWDDLAGEIAGNDVEKVGSLVLKLLMIDLMENKLLTKSVEIELVGIDSDIVSKSMEKMLTLPMKKPGDSELVNVRLSEENQASFLVEQDKVRWFINKSLFWVENMDAMMILVNNLVHDLGAMALMEVLNCGKNDLENVSVKKGFEMLALTHMTDVIFLNLIDIHKRRLVSSG